MIETKIYAPTPEHIAYAGKLLAEGDVVGIPTETVYGLAADAWNNEAVRRIFAVKGRPQDNPLIVHISAIEQMEPLVKEIPPLARTLAEKFWPGPLTIILEKNAHFNSVATAGMDTVGIRMPSHPVARAIIDAAGVPLAAPSANLSGIPSPTCAEHVYDDLNGRIACIIDGGECEVGVESTVVRVDKDTITLFRPGGVTVEQLQSVCDHVIIDKGVLEHLDDGAKVQSPGMKYRHYSPNVPVIILDGSYAQFAAYVHDMSRLHKVGAMVFAGEGGELSVPVMEYGVPENGTHKASGVFSALRKLDALGQEVFYARMPAKNGVGFAVYNRLLRAAGFHVVSLNAPRKIPVIGLTGQTGAGKSMVSGIWQQYGCYAIDCDRLARVAVEKGSDTLAALVKAFGKEILLADGSLNRKALGAIAFSNAEKLKTLNAITHPAILQLIKQEIAFAAGCGYAAAIVDAPTLFESKADALCDAICSVTADDTLRLTRIIQRDGLTEDAAKQRMAAQKDKAFYAERSDAVIENNADEAALRQQAISVLQQFDLPMEERA